MFLSCSFPGGSNENLLHKFNNIHKENPFYEKPQRKENAFIIRHYAGKVKYQVRTEFSSEMSKF
jgi:myosin heavy subunit